MYRKWVNSGANDVEGNQSSSYIKIKDKHQSRLLPMNANNQKRAQKFVIENGNLNSFPKQAT